MRIRADLSSVVEPSRRAGAPNPYGFPPVVPQGRAEPEVCNGLFSSYIVPRVASTALRKLLEAKDCAVRAVLFKAAAE